MASQGIGLPKNCPSAVKFFKTVAEKGDWIAIMSTQAGKMLQNGDR